jgi:hypothetical protein
MGWDVELVERAFGPREEGYLIDFVGPGFDAAETMGLLPRLRQSAYTLTEVNLSIARASREPPWTTGGLSSHSTAACSAWPAATSHGAPRRPQRASRTPLRLHGPG